MRDLLVVSYHFLPAHNVAVKQIAKYCKYLPEFGWRPVVITNDWSGGPGPYAAQWGVTIESDAALARELPSCVEVHPVGHVNRDNLALRVHGRVSAAANAGGRLRRSALGLFRRALSAGWPLYGNYPDSFAGWTATATAAAMRLVQGGSIAAILSQSPPEVNHVVASRVARRTKLPWFPIMGDLYHSYEGAGDMHGTGLRAVLTKGIQRHWLGRATGAFAVSPRMVRELQQTYGLPGEVVVVGFDPVEFEPPTSPRGGKLRLAHVGSLYLDDQRPDLFFDALDAFLVRMPGAARDIEVRIVGSKSDGRVSALLAGRPCAGVVHVEPKVAPAEAVRIQRESDALLLFDLTVARGSGGTLSYPSKVFEYLGARRPILSIPGDGDWVDQILRVTRAGDVARDAGEAAAWLERRYTQWRSRGRLTWNGDVDAIARYTHRMQAQTIARRLDAAVGVSGTTAASGA